jgi:hypothetical protein
MAKHSVFIGSTQQDLADYRQSVRDTVLAFDFFPAMMEYWPAMSMDAVELCMKKVDESDVYVGIFAHRYGYCPEGCDISITEMEFNRAEENNIPRLCFLIDETIPWSPNLIEDEPGKSRLATFKSRIDNTLIRAKFRNPDHLALEVAKALKGLEYHQPHRLKIGKYRVDHMSAPIDLTHAAKVQIFIEGATEDFNEKVFKESLGAILKIDNSRIHIAQVISGSIILDIMLPKKESYRLYSISERYTEILKSRTINTALIVRQIALMGSAFPVMGNFLSYFLPQVMISSLMQPLIFGDFMLKQLLQQVGFEDKAMIQAIFEVGNV